MIEIRPRTVVFVRHGESKANLVQAADKKGDSSGYTDEFRNTPNWAVELTETGIAQAISAGAWIRQNINSGFFDGYYVSSFRRARQTAGLLHLPAGEHQQVWSEKDDLREQSYGYLDGLTNEERHAKYKEIMDLKKRDKYYWAGPGGESMAQLINRARRGIVFTLHRELPDKTGICVSHGNMLWAIRVVLESMSVKMYQAIYEADDPLDKMNNCQVLEYTRVDPGNPFNISARFDWMRSVCPWDIDRSRQGWQEIQRPRFSNQDLLDY